eukprot:13328125-Heterocapsa_arctica.AAC.1
MAVGGLRRTALAIAKIPTIRQAGLLVGQAIDEVFTKDPDIVRKVYAAIRDRRDGVPISEAQILMIQRAIGGVVGCDDFEPVRGDD